MNLERIKMRADMGGHCASESVLRQICRSSTANLGRAIREMDFVSVYDNSRWGITPAVLLQAERGEIVYRAGQLPAWLIAALL